MIHLQALKNVKIVIFDFDGVFTNNQVIVSQKGDESVLCNRSDGLGLDMLRRFGIEMVIISTEKNPVVRMRADKLKIKCYYDCPDKLALLKEVLLEKKISLAKTAYVGNDINDLSCLEAVGLPVVVADAYPAVKKAAKIILKKKGGHGAVREFCEILSASQIKRSRNEKDV